MTNGRDVEDGLNHLVGLPNDPQIERSKGRTLSDADVDAIARRLKEHFLADFFTDLGKGVWGSFRKALVWAILAICVYFAVKGQNLIK